MVSVTAYTPLLFSDILERYHKLKQFLPNPTDELPPIRLLGN